MTTPYPGNPHWPSNFQSCTITGKFIGLDGVPLAGTVTFKPAFSALADPSALVIVIPRPIVATLDANGFFTIDVPATDDTDISPVNWTYTVTETFTGGSGRTYSIAAPSGTLVDLTIASPVSAPAAGVDTYYNTGQSDARFVQKSQYFTTLAKNPDMLIVGNITRNSDDVITSADVVWPDGEGGSFVADSISSFGIDSYHITYLGTPAKTYTQPAVTRNSNGAVISVPSIVVT